MGIKSISRCHSAALQLLCRILANAMKTRETAGDSARRTVRSVGTAKTAGAAFPVLVGSIQDHQPPASSGNDTDTIMSQTEESYPVR